MNGVKRVSVAEIDCLSNHYGKQLLMLSAISLPDVTGIPGSILIVGGGNPAHDALDTKQELVKLQLDHLTKGDRNRPLAVYCHHQNCLLSLNLLIRAQRSGYRNLYWLRGGTQEWRQAGKHLGLVRFSFDEMDLKSQVVLGCDSWSVRQIALGRLSQERYDAFIKPHVEAISKLHSMDTLTSAGEFHRALLDDMLQIAEELDSESNGRGQQIAITEANYRSQCRQLSGSQDLYP